MDDLKGRWADELDGVLWSIRTTVKESTGHTPFVLVYGTEAVLPMEMIVHSSRTVAFDAEKNEEALRLSLDLIAKKRDEARHNLTIYQNRMNKFYNRRVHERYLHPRDLVPRKAVATGKGNIHGKLSAQWEGPYLIKEALGPNTFTLEDPEGQMLPSH